MIICANMAIVTKPSQNCFRLLLKHSFYGVMYNQNLKKLSYDVLEHYIWWKILCATLHSCCGSDVKQMNYLNRCRQNMRIPDDQINCLRFRLSPLFYPILRQNGLRSLIRSLVAVSFLLISVLFYFPTRFIIHFHNACHHAKIFFQYDKFDVFYILQFMSLTILNTLTWSYLYDKCDRSL